MEEDRICIHFRVDAGKCDCFGKGCSSRKSRKLASSDCNKNGVLYKSKNLGFKTLLASNIQGDYSG